MPDRRMRVTLRRLLRRLRRDAAGATMLEWCLVLAAIALPSYAIVQIALTALTAHYRMAVALLELPFP